MAKNYFPHDFGSRNDINICKLRSELGKGAVDTYWSVVEILHEQGGFIPRTHLKQVANECRTSVLRLQTVLERFGLFIVTDEGYSSNRVRTNLLAMSEKSLKASESVKRRWAKPYERINNVDTTGDTNNKKKEYIYKEKNSSNVSFSDALLLNEMWMASAGKALSVHPQKIGVLMSQFDNHLTATQKIHPTEEEYARHFINWVRSSGNDNNRARTHRDDPERTPAN